MTKIQISDSIAAVAVRPATYYSLENKPPNEAIRKALTILGGMSGNIALPVIRGDAQDALQRSSRIRSLLYDALMHSAKTSTSKPEKLPADFFIWLLFTGIIIRTDDADARHVLDRQRGYLLCSNEPVQLQTDEARNRRLRELLNLAPRIEGEKVEPQPGLIEPAEVRRAVVAAARTRFNGLMDKYPELGDLAFNLGLLAAHSAKGRADGLNEATDNIGRLILALRDHIDSDALAIIDELTSHSASIDTARTGMFDPRAEIHALQLARQPIDSVYQKLSQQKNLADARLEHLLLEILDQDLRQKLRFAGSADKPQLVVAIERAEAVARTLEDYIDNLGSAMKPLKDLIDQIQKRIVALTILTLPEPITTFEQPTVGALPDFDDEQLLNWRSSTSTNTAAIEAQVEHEDDVSAEAPADVATELGLSLPSGRMNEEFIAAIFQVAGRRSAVRIMTVLRDIGLITNQGQKNWIFAVCIKMAAEGSATPFLKFCGNMSELAIYKAADSLPPDLADRLLPRALQERLREMMKPKPKK